MRIHLQPGFILHARPYRETSLLIDLFTQDHGRVGLIARGVRSGRSSLKALLQPFNPLLVSWQGRSELMTLSAAEMSGLPISLAGDCLLSGFYLNEVLTRVLQKYDPNPKLYTVYHQTLVELQSQKLEQKTLRLFEKRLLEELGYGLQLEQEMSTGKPLQAEEYYRFFPEQGFDTYHHEMDVPSALVFSGKSLIALANEQLDDPDCLRDAKRLMRLVLTPMLGSQPLHSRKLFIEIEK